MDNDRVVQARSFAEVQRGFVENSVKIKVEIEENDEKAEFQGKDSLDSVLVKQENLDSGPSTCPVFVKYCTICGVQFRIDTIDDNLSIPNMTREVCTSCGQSRPEEEGSKLIANNLECDKVSVSPANIAGDESGYTSGVLYHFRCQVCHLKFCSKKSMTNHIKKAHYRSELHQCSTCGKEFLNKCHLLRHKRLHTGDFTYMCSHCGKGFLEKRDLNTHEQGHVGKKPYQCPVCCQLFTRQHHAERHLRAAHPQPSHLDTTIGNVDIGDNLAPCKELEFKCDDCESAFSSIQQLNKHLSESHKGIKINNCSICDVGFVDEVNLVKHRKLHKSKHACNICGKEFKQRKCVELHKNVHNEKSFQCVLCGMMFNQCLELKLHTKKNHRSSLVCECRICGKSLSGKASLVRHLLIHDNKFLVTCNVCGKGFREKHLLERHRVKHTKEKPFKCDSCDKAYGWAHGLARHVRAEHSTERAYRCDICDQTFAEGYDLTVHMKLHTTG